MSKGIECELAILNTLASQGRVPHALRQAIQDSPWIMQEAGVSVPKRRRAPIPIPVPLLLAGGVALAAFPSLSYAQQFITYTVRPGDTLSSIAARHLGTSSRWKDIYQVNTHHLRSAHLIYPGQTLKFAVVGVSQKKTLKAKVVPQAKAIIPSTPIEKVEKLMPSEAIAAPLVPSKPTPEKSTSKNPFWPIVLRILDVLCLPLAIFGARQLWMKAMRRFQKEAPAPLPAQLSPANPVPFWEYAPGDTQSFNFLGDSLRKASLPPLFEP